MFSILRQQPKFAYSINFIASPNYKLTCIPKLGQRKLKKINKLLISLALQQEVEKALDGLKDNEYIMCVRYINPDNREFIDTQLFITGSANINEISNIEKKKQMRAFETVAAEFSEETRFKVNPENIMCINQYMKQNKNNTYYSDTYRCNIEDMELNNLHTNRESNEPENIKYKVTGVAYGDKATIIQAIAGIPRSPSCENNQFNDNIGGLIFISVYDVKKIIQIIKQKQKDRKKDPFWYSFSNHLECEDSFLKNFFLKLRKISIFPL